MNYLETLNNKIVNKQAKIGVIGLGYVGLPVACMFSQAGFDVTGLDIKQDRVDLINSGISPIEGIEPGLQELITEVTNSNRFRASTDYGMLKNLDIVLIDVETPTDQENIPQYVALRSACTDLAREMKDGILIIVESTIAPSTISKVVRPILEEVSGKKSSVDFFLGACPERVMPGKLLANLKSMSRVCGGETPRVSETMKLLYKNIVNADLDSADIITAEITKTAENTYRDVNIAFANELAMICQATGADFLKVRELVNKSPGRNVLMAGAGVGGHCIPKDPWLLAYGAKNKVHLHVIPAARKVNDSMPVQIANLLAMALEEEGVSLSESRIAVLGYAYLEESDDTRNSPSETLINYLKSEGAAIKVHDPFVSNYKLPLEEVLQNCDAVVIMVSHHIYRNLDLKSLKMNLKHPIIVDGRRAIDPQQALSEGFTYYGIGFGQESEE
jgi:UDP-N-acetyl-D-mannosaminuronic acid dehydrogenase